MSGQNPPTRKYSEELTDEDVPNVEDCHTQMDASAQIDFGSAEASGSINLFENDQLWGILRVVRTQDEFKLLHRHKDGLRDHYVIGRSKACDVVIPDKRVSSHHCSVYCDYSQATLRVYVEDNSSNGTFINGPLTKISRKERTELKSGDEIYVLNPELPTPTPESAGPFLFINMRDRYAIQKKIMHVSESESLRKRRTIGRHIEDEYIIGEQLGSGMCGQVHRCVHKSSKVQYAVKIINTRRFSLSPGLSTRELREEAEIMRNLNHPHIIRIQDAFEMGQTLYIVMELVTGGDLFDKIIELGKYSEDDARRILIKVMDAVSYLHGMNIVHRDLKPENILLTANSDSSEVKITDFGLAKRTNQEGLKTFCGTPQYFAPEVLRRKAPTDANGAISSYGDKADVWSIGVITYIMLSGSFPFDDDHLFDQIEHAQYSLSGAEWSTVSAQAKHFIRSLMNLDIQKRLDIQAAMRHPWIEEYRYHSREIQERSFVPPTKALSFPPLKAEYVASLPPLPSLVAIPAVVNNRENKTGHTIPTNSSIITPEKSSLEGEDSQVTGDSVCLAAEELLVLQRTHRTDGHNISVIATGEAPKPTIFWSDKAALVKLASIRKKVSTCRSNGSIVSPVDASSTVLSDGDNRIFTQRECSNDGRLKKPNSIVKEHIGASQVMNFDCAEASPQKINNLMSSHNTKQDRKRKQKSASAHIEGKVLSDDDIDYFSDKESAQPDYTSPKDRNKIKRSTDASKRDSANSKKITKKIKCSDSSICNVQKPVSPPAVQDFPLAPLEMGAHVPSRPMEKRMSCGVAGRRKSASSAQNSSSKIGSKSIETYFSKQRILRAPVPSLSAAFIETNTYGGNGSASS